jgi:flagellar motor switch/type III secretory pathway protein FliN
LELSAHQLEVSAESGILGEQRSEERTNSMSTAPQRFDNNPPEPVAPGPAEGRNDLLETMPWLPCTVTIDLPVTRFTIGDLLALAKGSIVETGCHHTSDLPLRVNNLLIGWVEFSVVGDRLAVRITEQV